MNVGRKHRRDKINMGFTPNLLTRFWSKVEKTDNCWNWKAYKDRLGYGVFWYNKHILAHRFTYQLFNGSIPDDKELDHLCRNRACVNPTHLEVVTHKENCMRGDVGKYNKKKTSCIHGHEYTPENTYTDKQDGTRECITCHRQYTRDWKAKNKDWLNQHRREQYAERRKKNKK